MLIDKKHLKSRMRRINAEIAIGEVPHIVQAELELEELLESGDLPDTVLDQAKEFQQQTKRLLKVAKKKYQRKTPDGDWDLYVREVRSKCW